MVFENDDALGDPIYALFKADDDLRQDMLTLQIITLMNKVKCLTLLVVTIQVWQRENLDLSLTPYTCLPLGPDKGMIEIVLESQTIANIQKVFAQVICSIKYRLGVWWYGSSF